ncbi:MAG: hypothetical protein H6Q86_4090 [candidate division NC10 bacterium]|nr:hypothetical protein [candidate division NC10 bacterium]
MTGRVALAPHLLDKVAAPENTCIPGYGVLFPPQCRKLTPAARTPYEAPTLEFWPPALARPSCHEFLVAHPRPRPGWAELGEDCFDLLPRPGDGPQEGTVPSPWIPIQRPEIRNDFGPEWVEVDVADQFQEIGLLLHDNRPVSVLKEMAHTPMPAVEGTSVSREQTPHALG